MPRNQKGDGKPRGKRRGCPSCNGFRANGTCVVCGEKRIGGYKKPQHKTLSRRMKNGNFCQETACWNDQPIQRKNTKTKAKGKYQYKRPEMQSKTATNDDDHSCQECGCVRHVDPWGERVCWCDACESIDWVAERRPIWNARAVSSLVRQHNAAKSNTSQA